MDGITSRRKGRRQRRFARSLNNLGGRVETVNRVAVGNCGGGLKNKLIHFARAPRKSTSPT